VVEHTDVQQPEQWYLGLVLPNNSQEIQIEKYIVRGKE
jgi:hypothetical protein